MVFALPGHCMTNLDRSLRIHAGCDEGAMSRKNCVADPTRLKPFDSNDKKMLRVVIETPKGSRNIGLCFGGGQLGLGLEGFAAGFLVLTGLKKVEIRIPRRHTGRLHIQVAPNGPTQGEIAALLTRDGLSVSEPALSVEGSPATDRVYAWKLEWKGRHEDINLPRAVQELSAHSAIRKLDFTR